MIIMIILIIIFLILQIMNDMKEKLRRIAFWRSRTRTSNNPLSKHFRGTCFRSFLFLFAGKRTFDQYLPFSSRKIPSIITSIHPNFHLFFPTTTTTATAPSTNPKRYYFSQVTKDYLIVEYDYY